MSSKRLKNFHFTLIKIKGSHFRISNEIFYVRINKRGDFVQYDVATPKQYLNALEEDWRKEKLLQIREMVLSYAPELDESIRYKMLNFGLNEADDYVFALNAQKHYVSLYVGDIEKIDPTGEMLKEYNLGKGCVRVRKTLDIDKTQLQEFIKQSIDLWRNGKDIDC